MAYYVKVNNFKRGVCGISRDWERQGVFNMASSCDTDEKADFLCEFESRKDVEKDLNKDSSINIATSHDKPPPFPHVKCPDDHVTHAFLACDSQSACWQRHHYEESEVWGVPSATSCPAPMTSLPPMFTCSSSEQRVPYSMVCDHRLQCGDGSDESFCVFPPCSGSTPLQCGTSSQVFVVSLVCRALLPPFVWRFI